MAPLAQQTVLKAGSRGRTDGLQLINRQTDVLTVKLDVTELPKIINVRQYDWTGHLEVRSVQQWLYRMIKIVLSWMIVILKQ